MDELSKLYTCLSLNHNFHLFNPADGFVWLGWCDKLAVEEKHIAAVIKRIDNGELQTILDRSREKSPTLQHIKTLLASVKRGANLDKTTENALGYNKPPNSEKEFIQEVTAKAIKDAEKGAFSDFDVQLYLKYNHEYMDAYHLARQTGNYRLLQRFIING